MVLNSSRSWEEKIRVTLHNRFCNRNDEKFMNQNLLFPEWSKVQHRTMARNMTIGFLINGMK